LLLLENPVSALAQEPHLAAAALRRGGVALLPTDTNYALGCLPDDEAACAKLYRIKRRPPEKPLTLFVRDADEARRYALLSPAEERLFAELTARFWPGPLNLIVPAGPRAPRHRFFDAHTLSLVCNRNAALTRLLHALGGPLALTSANVSGVAVNGLVSWDDAMAEFGTLVDVCVPDDDRAGHTTCSSTIVRITDGRVEVLRQGDVVIG
jgi:L-threonylcarbamoyladenylate synthase